MNQMSSSKPYPTDEQLEFLESMKNSWKLMEWALENLETAIIRDREKAWILLKINAMRGSCKKMYDEFENAKNDMSDLNH